jgi:type II secretory pathway pseudopilin PulG
LKKNNGFTLIEALVAMTIVIFIVVTILAGFTQQMVTNRYDQYKNGAIRFAENKMEDFSKYPASQMPAGSVDYIYEANHKFVVQTAAPNPPIKNQYRRTVTITDEANMKIILVTVDYGWNNGRYPAQVVLTSRRGG